MPEPGPQPAEAESAPPASSAPIRDPDSTPLSEQTPTSWPADSGPADPVADSWPADPVADSRPADRAPGLQGAGTAPIEFSSEPFELSGSGERDDDNARTKRSLTHRIVLGSLLAAGIAGVAVLGWAGWQVSSQKDATVTVPASVAGLRLDDSQSGRDTADYLQTALAAEVNLNNAVGGVYTDGASRNVLFFGGTALIWSPGSDLDTAFGLISDDQGAVTGVHDVPSGEYGGVARCGTTRTGDGVMPVCGWADHGSLGLGMFPGRSESESARLLVQIRDVSQHRH